MTGLADRIGTVETRIVRRLLNAILARGYAVDVREAYGDEEEPAFKTRSLALAVAEIGHTEATLLDVYAKPDDERPLGWFVLIHGNGPDVVTDYTDRAEFHPIYEATENSA